MGTGSKGRVRSGTPGAPAGELSAGINRVRRACGPIPMADFADRPEILQAARQVNRVDWRRMRGEAGAAAW
ncbi:MAG: hypothetical protein FJY95_01415 [Candidatus Handelsmanbacteria bacterium]|nr:hypothetical protein [Candidatus Handelsmanbacteria bacterium]